MNRAATKLLIRPRLWPDESLPSYLLRLSQANGYPSLSLLRQVCHERLSRSDTITRPKYAQTFQVLSALTQIDPRTLYAASVQRFAATLIPPNFTTTWIQLATDQPVPILPKGFLTQLTWPETDVQFCPRCLQERLYHRITWMPMPIAICLDHHCLLQRGCPGCERSVSVNDLLTGLCPQCHFSLVDSSLYHLTDDQAGLTSQRLLQDWLGLHPPATSPSLALPDQPPATLFRLVDGLRHVLMPPPGQWPHFHRPPHLPDTSLIPCFSKRHLTPLKAYILYTTACQALPDWPHRFYDFLDAYKARYQSPPAKGIQDDFGPLYTTWLVKNWQHPAFAFIQQAFDLYLLDRYPALPNLVRWR